VGPPQVVEVELDEKTIERYAGECLGETSLFSEWDERRRQARLLRNSLPLGVAEEPLADAVKMYAARATCTVAELTELLFLGRQEFHTLLDEISANAGTAACIAEMRELAEGSKEDERAGALNPMRRVGELQRQHSARRSSFMGRLRRSQGWGLQRASSCEGRTSRVAPV